MKVIEDTNISHAWARAVRAALQRRGEVIPLIVSVAGGFDGGTPPSDPILEAKLDELLGREDGRTFDQQCREHTLSTITVESSPTSTAIV